MQKIFRRYLYVIMGFAVLAILAANFIFSGSMLKSQQKQTFDTKLDQIVQTMVNNQIELETLTSGLEEDYLTRAKAFSYIIQKNPAVLNNFDELQMLKTLLNVDELHVTDENGIIVYSTVFKYLGFDFHSGEQTRGFLPILESDDPDIYVMQEEQPNSAEGKLMKYVGVPRPDEKGIVQVGLEPLRLLDTKKRNTCSYIFSRIPTNIGEILFAVGSETGKILGNTNAELENTALEDSGQTLDALLSCKSGAFLNIFGERCYIVTRQYDNLLLGASIPENTLYGPRIQHMLLLFSYLILIIVIMIVALNILLREKVVKGIHTILKDLKRITEGHLDTPVDNRDNPELEELSLGINSMMENIRYEHNHDSLTGLNTYPYFRIQVQQLLKQQQGYAAGVMLDLDDFKQINDSYGHDFGDRYLIALARLMHTLPETHCISSRRSGDEFSLFFYDFETPELLLQAVRDFWNSLPSHPIYTPDGRELAFSVSGGLAWAKKPPEEFDQLMFRADQELYEVKRAQKGSWKESEI